MAHLEQKYLLLCLRQLLRALAKFCLRHAFKVSQIESLLRQTLLEVAQEEMGANGQKVNQSRLSIVSGLSRREVAKSLESVETAQLFQETLITKVVGLWQSEKRFLDKKGEPRILTYGSGESEFNTLVARVSTDINPATVLFELERIGAVERQSDGLRLVTEIYRPKGDPEIGFRVLGKDVSDLITTVEENIFEKKEIGNLHLRTEYDRVRIDARTQIEHFLLKEGNALHAKARDFISQFDQDTNPDPDFKGTTVRVVLGSYGKVFIGEK